jgi:hypothetical protein
VGHEARVQNILDRVGRRKIEARAGARELPLSARKGQELFASGRHHQGAPLPPDLEEDLIDPTGVMDGRDEVELMNVRRTKRLVDAHHEPTVAFERGRHGGAGRRSHAGAHDTLMSASHVPHLTATAMPAATRRTIVPLGRERRRP